MEIPNTSAKSRILQQRYSTLPRTTYLTFNKSDDKEVSSAYMYQDLENEQIGEKKKKSCVRQRGFLVALIVLAALHYILFGTIEMSDNLHGENLLGSKQYRREHVVPTLLSTTKTVANASSGKINGENGNYVKLANALQNEVYDRLNYVESFLYYRAGQVKLMLDKEKVSFGEAISLTWSSLDAHNNVLWKLTGGLRYSRGNYIGVDDSDIIALYCWADETQSENEKLEDSHKFKDATTIYQVKMAAAKLLFPKVRNTWRIPHFPIIREQSCLFRLWGNVDADMDLRGKSMVLKGSSEKFEVVCALDTPTAIHLALTTSPTEMRVHFTTGRSGNPIVHYGADPERLTQSKQGVSRTYAASDMCEAPANETGAGKFTDPGMLHDIVMTDLKLDTRYYYKVGLEYGEVWSSIYSFISAPPVSPDSSFSFVVFADQGCPETGWTGEGAIGTSTGVAAEVREKNVRAVHLVGDLSYADGAGHVYDSWFDMIQQFTSLAPFMVAVGNHEYVHMTGGVGKDPSGVDTPGGFHPPWGNYHDEGGECGVPVDKRFVMPNSGNGIFWYSYDYASAHFIVLSSEHDLSPSSVQYDWLQNDLQHVDRNKTPWLIIESHRPLYEPENIPPERSTIEGIRREIEPLMHEFSVDLFLSGHYHSYFRSCKGLYKEMCNNGGPQYITIGTGGGTLFFDNENLDSIDFIQNNWSEFFTKKFGYGRITVANATSLHWEFVSDNGNRILDHVWLTK